jgi:DNA-binding winged helix-turn-helix (wHTH) protein
MRYRFNQFILDTDRFELSQNGAPLHVEPPVLELLVLLIENRDRMISKEEINHKVWSGRIVSETALSSRIKIALQVLGDDGRRQQFIRTVHKKGFSFVAEVGLEETDLEPKFINTQSEMIACCSILGDFETANRHRLDTDTFAPDFIPDILSGKMTIFKNPEHSAMLVDGMRAADVVL